MAIIVYFWTNEDAAHDENTSILSYNDENSLACVLSLGITALR